MKPIVCYVTDRKAPAVEPIENPLAKIRGAVAAGVDWVQVRERNMPARELLALARAAINESEGRTRILINDRLDVALAAGAAGVHLGGTSAPAGEVIRWCRAGNAPPEFLIGISCHGIEDVQKAEAAGASYVFFGPVFETPSKKSFGPPQGVTKLAEACRAARIPAIAIGGVNEGNAAECMRAGAAGIAAIRMFQEIRQPDSLRKAIARLHDGG